jgi:hypothetical protein
MANIRHQKWLFFKDNWRILLKITSRITKGDLSGSGREEIQTPTE